MRASIRQVAQRAGVSAMTVTNVLRHSGKVARDTEQRVLRAVQELNYIPVRSATQNRHVVTNVIGLLSLHDMDGSVGDPTFRGVVHQAREYDYDLTILLRSRPKWARDGWETRLLDRRCDGFIFVGHEEAGLSALLVEHKIPVVEAYSVAPPAGVARVVGDNRRAMELAVEHLVAAGHRRIAHISGPESSSEACLRRDAFCDAVRTLTGSDPTPNVVRGDTWGDGWGFDIEGEPGDVTRPLAEAVLKKDVTAVVCANDTLALAVWKMAELQAKRVPDDLSIIGMDNLIEAAHKGLTTIAQPHEKIGRAAVDAVIHLLRGGTAEEASRVLPVELIVRRSVAAPRL